MINFKKIANLEIEIPPLITKILKITLLTIVASVLPYLTVTLLGGFAPVYGASVALAANLFEFRLKQRLFWCIPSVLFGFFSVPLISGIMILGTMFIAALFSAKNWYIFFKRSRWQYFNIILHRFLRTFIAIGVTMALFSAPLDAGCPFGSGYTEYRSTFLIMTYLPILGMILLDTCFFFLCKIKSRPTSAGS